MLLLAASALPEGRLCAQSDESNPSDRYLERPVDEAAGPAFDAALKQQRLIEDRLAAGRAALLAGRIDRPPNDCAWFYYQAVLDLDPENAEAKQGLVSVQKALVARAIEIARDMDFETAERILEDGVLVRESSELIEQAQAEILAFRSQHAGELESKAMKAMEDGNFTQAERALIELIALGGADGTVGQLRRRLKEARVYGGLRPGEVIKDRFIKQDLWTPESVVIPAGSYSMGSPAFEEGRKDNEGPRHRVTFRRGFAIGRTEVTVKEFRVFVQETRYRTDAYSQGYSTVYNHSSGRLTRRDDVTWEMSYEGREAKDIEPVVHVSWNDATAYLQWLARGTGKAYRLPTEAEFEFALRAGRNTRYWWGDGVPAKTVENLTGEHDVSRDHRQWSTYFEAYEDTFWGPAPVASFETNPFGLYDMAGNVGEWVSDCWHDTYLRAPVDGTAWLNPGCKLRTIRGGYWASSPDQARSAFRLSSQPDRRDARIGFRIARDL